MSARIGGADDRVEITFNFKGSPVGARLGDTIAMALWANSERVLRHSSRDGAPRGVLCNMGICYECLVTVDGDVQRACTTVVREGMVVERGGRP